MSVVGLKKLLLKDALHTAPIENFLLRCYEQIITGIWGSMVLFFLESTVYWNLGRYAEAKYFSKKYFIIFIIYTIFFLLSSILIPKIRKVRLRRKLHDMIKERNLTNQQKETLKSIIVNNMLCMGFFTKLGFAQFLMITISNTIFIDACYSFEFFIDVVSTKDRPLELLLVFVATFIFLLILVWYMDMVVAKMIKCTQRRRICSTNNKKDAHMGGKKLMIEIMQLITKDTLENRTGQIIIEDFLTDIYKLMCVSNELNISSKPNE